MFGPKKSKRLFVQTTQNCPGTIREGITPLGKGGNDMQTQTPAEASKDQQLDEELADTFKPSELYPKDWPRKSRPCLQRNKKKRKEVLQMSKMSELSQVLSELKDCGQTLMNIADSLTELFSSTSAGHETPAPPPEEPKPAYSFVEVRKKFAEMSRAGHTDALKDLLKKHGADKLSSIDPSQYAALLADAEAIQ